MKTNTQRVIEITTLLTAAEICDRVLRKTAGNDVSAIFKAQPINEVASTLVYAGMGKGIFAVGGRK